MPIHPFVPSARATSPRNPMKSAQTVPLPNGSKLPTANSSAESFWRNLPSLDGFFHQAGLTNQTLSCTKFWCWHMPLQLRDKSDFIPKLTPIANVSRLNLFKPYSLSSQSIGASVQIQTLGHPSPKLEPSMAGQNQSAQVNFIPASFIRHYPFRYLLPQISPSVFLW
jgi:hypothetical protein